MDLGKSMDGGATVRAVQSMGWHKVEPHLSDFTLTFHFHALEKLENILTNSVLKYILYLILYDFGKSLKLNKQHNILVSCHKKM